MYVKNAPGLSVRDPDRNDRLPADQYRAVPDSDYWLRRVQAGDVVTHANPPVKEMEGYEPPEAPKVAEPEQSSKRAKPDA